MPSIADELAARVRRFSIRAVKFARAMPREAITETIVRQLVKSVSELASLKDEGGRLRAIFVASLKTARYNYRKRMKPRE